MGDMPNIDLEFRNYINKKLDDKTFLFMCYASISFEKQRRAVHEFISDLKKQDEVIFGKMNIFKYVVTGDADDLTGFYNRLFPDFMSRFGKGISIKRIFEITAEEMGKKEV